MAVKLPNETGLILGPNSIDILPLMSKLADAAKFAGQRTVHLVPSEDGTIKTVSDAEQALKDGNLEVNDHGGRTLVYTFIDGALVAYAWDTEEQELHKLGRPVGNNLINFTGANHIKFDNNGDLFNFNKSWFVSVQLLTIHSSNAFQTMFSAGDNTFNFLAYTGNYGIYLDDREPVTQGGSSRQNTWIDPGFDRVMLNYNHNTKKLEYWVGPMGSNPVVRILDIEQYQGDPAQLYETPTEFCVGKAMGGTGAFKGEGNEMIAGTQYLGSTQVQAIFSGDGKDWSSFPEITIHASLGEGTWPSVEVTGSVLSNGQMIGGSSNDYQPIPEE